MHTHMHIIAPPQHKAHTGQGKCVRCALYLSLCLHALFAARALLDGWVSTLLRLVPRPP